MLAGKLLAGGGAETLYAEDVFSAYTYTGNGSTQTITNGIDLAGKGGMVWQKIRSGAIDHLLFDTARGAGYYLASNTTAAQGGPISAPALTFQSNGFTTNAIANGTTVVGWTFRNADKFYNHTTVVKTGGSNATVSFANLTTLGMVRVKRTDAAGSWYIWHRSLTAGKLLIGETTAAEATLGHITVSGTTVTLVNGVIADGTYLVEGFAHDASADGVIQCGSFTTDGSGNATVSLGWEPQFLMVKGSIGGSAVDQWRIVDDARGFTTSLVNDAQLLANTSSAEFQQTRYGPTAVGFVAAEGASTTYIYLAIRRPNKPPTTGTQVYNAIARTGTGAAATVTGVGFAPDLVITSNRNASASTTWPVVDRLRGSAAYMCTAFTSNESAFGAGGVTSFTMDGFKLDGQAPWNDTFGSATYINWFFKRAPGVLSQICYSGTGANKTESHDLGVAPELWLVKGRSGATQWVWGSSLLANTEKIVMPTPAGKVTDATAWNSAYPTSTVLSLGTAAAVNTSAATYTAYLWATKAGISKVFSYTGNGSSQNIDCGFTTGARFILIVRTSAAGSVYIWDTVRGIVAGNDPYLALDTTAVEVTTDDSVDPLTSGFSVNQVAATNINVNGATYLGLAYA